MSRFCPQLKTQAISPDRLWWAQLEFVVWFSLRKTDKPRNNFHTFPVTNYNKNVRTFLFREKNKLFQFWHYCSNLVLSPQYIILHFSINLKQVQYKKVALWLKSVLFEVFSNGTGPKQAGVCRKFHKTLIS